MMKKNIYKILFVFGFLTVLSPSCKEEQGQIPGNDPEPAVTLYDYQVEAPYNPDNDVRLRIVNNNKVEALYIFIERTVDKEQKIKSKGEESYLNDIVASATRVDVKNKAVTDTVVTGILGKNTITVVGVGAGGKKDHKEITFNGLIWEDLGEGDFASSFTRDTSKRQLQKVEGGTVYRLQNLYKEGFHLLFTINDDNSLKFEKQETGIVHKKYGMISFGPALNGSVKDGNTFTFVGSFSVSAGAFGDFKEVFTLP